MAARGTSLDVGGLRHAGGSGSVGRYHCPDDGAFEISDCDERPAVRTGITSCGLGRVQQWPRHVDPSTWGPVELFSSATCIRGDLRALGCDDPTDADGDSGRATAVTECSSTVAPAFRPVTSRDARVLVELMRRTGVHFAGTRHDAVYRAIVADSLGTRPRITTAVADVDDTAVAFVSAITADAPAYWRSLVVRHPRAAAAMAWTRTRKLRRRIRYRRRKNALYDTDVVLTPRVELPPEVVGRLGQRPPAHGSPRPGEHGHEIALGLFMAIDAGFRGRGLGVPLFRELFVELRRAGAVRYDCSFSSKDPAAIRMHCNFPFTIYRLPGGYWASLRLADLDG